MFLIFSKLSNDYKQTILLKVNLTNVEDEIILQDDSSFVMEAYIKAKGFALVPFIFKNYKTIVLDAKTDVVTKPEHYIFDVDKHKYLIELQLGSSYKVVSLKPDSLVISYSKRASKYIPIDLMTDIDFASGFDILDGYSLSTDSVKIVGSLDQISKIKSIVTQKLTLRQVNKDINKSVKLKLYEGLDVFPKAVNVEAKVRRFTEGKIEIPITIKNKPSNTVINYFPKTVTVLYYVDLDHYNSINISDFSIECDYTAIEENQSYIIPKITKKPEFVKRISVKQKRIDFIKL
ncbi:CdaR family protein [uncultured Winogradskyella sp.]|uniref:CdaR family protein n=1 Tax=uncultured Winogradskyella sp. TaxID=395353 RepID=UPI002616DA14|nr:CdaR family protein [uncultured Winogradskyella sp.]